MSEQTEVSGIGPEVLKDISANAPGVSVVRAVAQRLGVVPNRQIRAEVKPAPINESLQLGAVDVTQEAPEGTTTNSGDPKPARFDLKAHQDELVEVKVGSETTTVRVSDMVGGYMRNADFTRKTQALADDRRKLESGTPDEDRQMLELGRKVATNPEAVEAIRGVLGEGGSEPEDATERRFQKLEQAFMQKDQVETARKNLESLIDQHPEARDHLSDVVAEMKRTGSKDPVTTWRGLDYDNVPDRLKETAEAARLKKSEAASAQSVVNTPTGASAGSSETVPAKDSSGRILSGRDFVRGLLEAV